MIGLNIWNSIFIQFDRNDESERKKNLTRKVNQADILLLIYRVIIIVVNGVCMNYVLLTHQEAAAAMLFDPEHLTAGEPPNDRGCRRCRRIGHLVKNCPQRGPETTNSGRKRSQQPEHEAAHPINGNSNNRRLESSTGYALPKKRDEESLLAEKGFAKLENSLPKGTKIAKIERSKLVDVFKLMLDKKSDRSEVMSMGYRIYTIQWFLSIEWNERFTFLNYDVVLKDKEPLVIIQLETEQSKKAQDNYSKQFMKMSNYFEKYIVDLDVQFCEGDELDNLETGLFKKGLDDIENERREKLEKKKVAKKEAKKLRREATKRAGATGPKSQNQQQSAPLKQPRMPFTQTDAATSSFQQNDAQQQRLSFTDRPKLKTRRESDSSEFESLPTGAKYETKEFVPSRTGAKSKTKQVESVAPGTKQKNKQKSATYSEISPKDNLESGSSSTNQTQAGMKQKKRKKPRKVIAQDLPRNVGGSSNLQTPQAQQAFESERSWSTVNSENIAASKLDRSNKKPDRKNAYKAKNVGFTGIVAGGYLPDKARPAVTPTLLPNAGRSHEIVEISPD